MRKKSWYFHCVWGKKGFNPFVVVTLWKQIKNHQLVNGDGGWSACADSPLSLEFPCTQLTQPMKCFRRLNGKRTKDAHWYSHKKCGSHKDTWKEKNVRWEWKDWQIKRKKREREEEKRVKEPFFMFSHRFFFFGRFFFVSPFEPFFNASFIYWKVFSYLLFGIKGKWLVFSFPNRFEIIHDQHLYATHPVMLWCGA